MNYIKRFPNNENSLHSWDIFALASDAMQMSVQDRLEKRGDLEKNLGKKCILLGPREEQALVSLPELH